MGKLYLMHSAKGTTWKMEGDGSVASEQHRIAMAKLQNAVNDENKKKKDIR